MKKLIYIATATLIAGVLNAQEFWSRIGSFPKSPTTGIATVDKSLLVTTKTALLRSVNETGSWDTLLTASDLRSLYSNNAGTVLVGSKGRIYTSLNSGQNWNTAVIDSALAVKEFISTSAGILFALGMTEPFAFPTWGAIYSSVDGGNSWNEVISGANDGQVYDQLSVDKSNRVYITARRESMLNSGGLYVSEDNGTSWSHIPLVVDGKNTINDEVGTNLTTGLNATGDTIYMSILGISGSVAVRLNVKKAMTDIMDSTIKWSIDQIATNWWMDKPMNDMFIESNGDRYSSSNGIFSVGGTFYRSPGQAWKVYRSDLSHNNRFSNQFFAESQSAVYMVHYLDSNLYRAIEPVATSVSDNQKGIDEKIYPNPVEAGNLLTIPQIQNGSLELYDTQGRFVKQAEVRQRKMLSDLPPGLYVLFNPMNRMFLGRLVVIND
jgi:hypothetical protein